MVYKVKQDFSSLQQEGLAAVCGGACDPPFAAHSTVQEVRGVQVCGSLTDFAKGLKNVKAVTWITLHLRLED